MTNHPQRSHTNRMPTAPTETVSSMVDHLWNDLEALRDTVMSMRKNGQLSNNLAAEIDGCLDKAVTALAKEYP